jgi:hypothetical protein
MPIETRKRSFAQTCRKYNPAPAAIKAKAVRTSAVKWREVSTGLVLNSGTCLVIRKTSHIPSMEIPTKAANAAAVMRILAIGYLLFSS